MMKYSKRCFGIWHVIIKNYKNILNAQVKGNTLYINFINLSVGLRKEKS